MVAPSDQAAPLPAFPADRAALSLTRALVSDDEVIILLLRPSLLYILLSALGSLVFIACITFALAYLGSVARNMPWIGWSAPAAFGLGLGLIVLRLSWQFLEWLSRVYILTDRRVIVRWGVLRVAVFQTPLKNIQHTTVVRRVRERLTGLGSIGFATAGSDTLDAFWVYIHAPFVVHRTVVDAIKRYGR